MPKIFLMIISSLLVIQSCKVSDKALKTAGDKNDINTKFDFPLDWIGIYEGVLTLYNGPMATSRVKMKLQIANPNEEGLYPWIMVYGEDDFRNYGLEAIDPEKGYYILDEFNSIKLDAYHKSNHLITKFSVKGTDLIVDYERVPGGIDVLFYVSFQDPTNITGGEIFENDTIPKVSSYHIAAFQKAVLKQIE